MKQIRRKGDYLTEEQRQAVIKEIINYYITEREQEIGVVAAEEILDFVLSLVGDYIRNYSLEEAKNLIRQHVINLETDIELAKS